MVGLKTQKELRAAFKCTLIAFPSSTSGQSKVLFRVKVLPERFPAALQYSELDGIIYSFVIL